MLLVGRLDDACPGVCESHGKGMHQKAVQAHAPEGMHPARNMRRFPCVWAAADVHLQQGLRDARQRISLCMQRCHLGPTRLTDMRAAY
jgi:hypothetical protein